MTDQQLIGSCGLYCRACPRYRVTLPDGRYLMESYADTPYEDFYCNGCHSQKLSKFCQQCAIRWCAQTQNYHHCGQCEANPCEKITAFAAEGSQHAGARHRCDVIGNLARLITIGAERWLAEQDQRWRCACGFIYSGYETHCHHCGEPLNSYANKP